MSGLQRITTGGNIGALRAFGKGFVLRNAFRGKPFGSLRPRSSGIGADENKVRFSHYDCSGRGPPLGSRSFCCGSNMNVLLTSERTVAFFGERRILSTV